MGVAFSLLILWEATNTFYIGFDPEQIKNAEQYSGMMSLAGLVGLIGAALVWPKPRVGGYIIEAAALICFFTFMVTRGSEVAGGAILAAILLAIAARIAHKGQDEIESLPYDPVAPPMRTPWSSKTSNMYHHTTGRKDHVERPPWMDRRM